MANFWDNDTEVKSNPFDAALKAEGVTGQVADIARSIYQQESGSGKNTKTSNAGAVGGMQIIPATFNRMADKGWAIDDPTHNARAGIRYIKTLYDKAGGDPALTASGYYGGEGAIVKAKAGIAVSDPRNPNAPNTLQYGQQVAARLPTQPAQAPQANPNFWENDTEVTQPAKPAPKSYSLGGFIDSVKEDAGNIGAGLVRGAGSIGNTILAAGEMLPSRLIPRVAAGGNILPDMQAYKDRSAGMDTGLKELGANPESYAYKGGKLAGEIAGTAGTGNVLALGARGLGAAPTVVNALRSGGMAGGGNLATRVGAGAATGAASTALINPDIKDVGLGAVIGGVLPGGAMLLGGASQKAGAAYRSLLPAKETAVANKFAAAVGLTPEELRQAVSIQAPSMIPGYEATVPQILQNPVASQIQRNLKASGNVSLGNAERTQQSAYRGAMENIAPIDLSVQDAANRAGNAVQDYAKPSLKDASGKVTDLFNSVPADEAMMHLPLQEMQKIQNQYFGAGAAKSKGKSAVESIMQEASNIGFDSAGLTSKVVPFDQLQRLRASINTGISDATDNTAKAALTSMKNAVDNKIASVVSGNKLPGEVFTPNAADIYGQALAEHSAKQAKFATGPQVGIFRQGGDNQAAIQGAEIPGKFYNGNRSQVEDVKAFKNLIGNRTDLADEMKRYAMTEGASTSNQFGDLTSKFTKWMQSRSGANRELFTEQENATLREVGKSVERSIAAENLARSTGSDTAQKIKTMESMGMLDNKFVNGLVLRTPVVGKYLDAGLLSLKNTASQAQSNELARLLASPQAMQQALSKKQITPQDANMLTKLLQQGSYRAAPALIAQ